MKHYTPDHIHNIAIAGHSGSGKTTLFESICYLSGVTNRLGKVSEGSTVSDYDPEEIRRKSSIGTSIAPITWKNEKLNIMDTPGQLDFIGALLECLHVADSVVITVSGKGGVLAGTDRAFKEASKRGLSTFFFVNGLCDEDARFYRVFETLKAHFGPAICPVVVPFIENGKAQSYINLLEYKTHHYGIEQTSEGNIPDIGTRLDGLRTAIYEAVAETSDEMFEKYFSGESFTPEEIIVGIRKGVKDGSVFPVFCGDALSTYAIDQLLTGLSWLAPSFSEKNADATKETGSQLARQATSQEDVAAIVFKTQHDPYRGKRSYIKVLKGSITPNMSLQNPNTGSTERIHKVESPTGKFSKEISCLIEGDIGILTKLQDTHTGNILCTSPNSMIVQTILYPKGSLTMAVYPTVEGEEDKVAQGLLKLREEDPTLQFETCQETHEMLLSGMGEQHLDITIARLKENFSVECTLQPPKIAYREAIRKKVRVQGRYKKQTGGHGQYGDVWIEFEPSQKEGLDFCEAIVGGVVPKGYFPAVEKGLLEAMSHGPLTAYPLMGLKATLVDGSYHPVDSSEMSFKMAAILAFKNGLTQAEPILLEPYASLKVSIANSHMGDIMGEITKRRGRVLGMQTGTDGYDEIDAEVPMAESWNFSTFVQQIAKGYGTCAMTFSHYEELPHALHSSVIKSLEQKKK